MNLKERISEDFMVAYKAKDMNKKNFLGVLKGAIQTQEGKNIESTDENVLKVIKSLEKGINETIEAKVKVAESISEQELELSYLSPYLPTLLSEDEVRSLVKSMMNTTESVVRNQGFFMGMFNKQNQGKPFDNKMVSKIIMEELKA